jgi:hypothetical protein
MPRSLAAILAAFAGASCAALLCPPLLDLAKYIPAGAVAEGPCYNTSQVTSINGLFQGVTGFPAGLAAEFDTSSVTDFRFAFELSNFDGPIRLDFRQAVLVTNFLREDRAFNQPLHLELPLATNIIRLLLNARGMTHDVTVVAPSARFAERAFQGMIDVAVNLTSTASLQSIPSIFRNSEVRPYISDTTGVTRFDYAFAGRSAVAEGPLDWLDTRSGQDFTGVFMGSTPFRQDLSHLDVAAGTAFAGMFAGTDILEARAFSDGQRQMH